METFSFIVNGFYYLKNCFHKKFSECLCLAALFNVLEGSHRSFFVELFYIDSVYFVANDFPLNNLRVIYFDSFSNGGKVNRCCMVSQRKSDVASDFNACICFIQI